ncbi:MAG TPA: tRNA (adenosine(37)-N6)-dimethylallyltransferase MiaA [Stellaceae bacterium]|nr:tRNA (adenosine(37)-N6)-dimethylallyltransferase MiaA [Stellaceae bacterium]
MEGEAAALVVVAGPTASGKSALALAVAEEFRGTVINADSMQVYRDLDVLAARPGAAETARAPHRLYGFSDAAEPCSAGRWRALALAEIAAARGEGRQPILAGGTGLYLRALLEGLAPVPAVPAEIREQAKALHARLGGAAFRAALSEVDPEASARLAAGDTQRLIRAYEVATATGRTLAAWRRGQSAPPFQAAAILLLPPRAELYAACDARFLAMMERGAEREARALLARGLSPELPAMKAVGLRELAELFAGRLSREAAIAAAQQATRRYAKRQYTWFRHQLPERAGLRKLVLAEQFSESLLPGIFSFIRQFLLTIKA